jgi:hypothetical protein
LDAEVVEIQRIGVKTEPEFPSRPKKTKNKKVKTKDQRFLSKSRTIG